MSLKGQGRRTLCKMIVSRLSILGSMQNWLNMSFLEQSNQKTIELADEPHPW